MNGCNRRKRKVDLWRSLRSPEVTICKTADELVSSDSNGDIFVSIDPVVPEL